VSLEERDILREDGSERLMLQTLRQNGRPIKNASSRLETTTIRELHRQGVKSFGEPHKISAAVGRTVRLTTISIWDQVMQEKPAAVAQVIYRSLMDLPVETSEKVYADKAKL